MNKINTPAYVKIDVKNLRDRVSKLTKKEGINKWDLGVGKSTDSSVQVDNGEAKQMKASERNSITIRVWNKSGLIGITTTTDLSDQGLSKAISVAHDASQLGNPNDIPDFSPLADQSLPSLVRPIRQSLGIKSMLDLLRNAEADLKNQHEAIKSVPYNGLAEGMSERCYLNSQGALRHILRSQASIYLYARAEEKGRKPRSAGSMQLAHGTSDLEIAACINDAANKTIDHLNYRPITTGKYLICFMPEAFLDLIGAFSSMFNARSVIDGVSLSKPDSLNKVISVPFFNLHDNGLHPAHIGASSFDGEGTPTKNICLVQSGKLINFLHSEATAKSFGVDPTGHAGLGAKVSVGPDWFQVSKNINEVTNQNELCHKNTSQKFVLIEELSALHAGVKPSQGSFSLPFDGWLVDKGEKLSIEAATVAGDIKTLLKQIVHIEDDEVITNHGVSPYIWVDNLTITGEA